MAVAPALTDACSITPGTKPDPLQRRPMQGAFGTASYELGVPMSPQLRMPIASNTKLITSVALHQLQEQVGEGEGRCGRCAEQAMAPCILSCWQASSADRSSRSTTHAWHSQPLLTSDRARKAVLPLTARLCPAGLGCCAGPAEHFSTGSRLHRFGRLWPGRALVSQRQLGRWPAAQLVDCRSAGLSLLVWLVLRRQAGAAARPR